MSEMSSPNSILSYSLLLHEYIKNSEYLRVKHTLDLARREINRQDPRLALRYLRSLTEDIARYEGTPAWAEHSLLAGEAYLAMRDVVAGEFLSEALTRKQAPSGVSVLSCLSGRQRVDS